MIRSRQFWRLFWTFFLTLLVTVMILSSMMIFMVREERKSALEGELLLQARDVAKLMQQQQASLSLWPFDQSLNSTLEWKLKEIRTNYDVNVWIVSKNGYVTVLGEQDYTQEQLNDIAVLEQLYKVLSGEEIRVQGLIRELGQDVVTLGVPWYSADNRTQGAVLVHVSTESLAADYSDMIRYTVIAGLAALVVGTALSLILSRRQSEPIHKIRQAVTEFADGNLDRRVEIVGNDDMAQLAEAINQMAEDLSNLEESRKSFVASVSHELRSPLTCIQGYVQGLMDGTIPDQERNKYLDVVLSETKRLTKLVSELLDLSRFESGNFPLTLSRFDVNELILVELLKFEGKIESKHIDVEIHFRDKQSFVEADSARIRQVVTNLVDNAVKFLNEGGSLTVSTHTVDNLTYISIKDDGPGIAQEDLPFIFDRFYKADKAHTSGMGTGLGLAIVKRILEQHGQTVKATSTAGGTTFTFTLPAAAANP